MASLTVSTRSLRYSSAMAWRLRSAVCSAARLCNQRSIYVYAKRPAASRLRCTSATLSRYDPSQLTPQIRRDESTPVGARKRSYWSRGRMSLWGSRFNSLWHRPGCQWVNSDGDPRVTPRDKDCPACREEQMNPEELAPRELLWQRKMHVLKSYIDKDPYQALFGLSNDRLRGVLPRLWVDLDRMIEMSRVELLQGKKQNVREPQQTKQEMAKSAPEAKSSSEPKPEPIPKQQATKSPQDQSILKPKQPTGEQGPLYRHEVKQFVISQSNKPNGTEPVVKGYGTWKVSGRDGQSSYEASGELEYDPITMRMVPRPSNKVPNTNNPELAIEKAKENAIQIPIKKSPDALAPIPKEQASKSSVEIAKETAQETALKSTSLPGLHLAKTLLKQTDESLKTTQRETNVFDIFKPPPTQIENSIPEVGSPVSKLKEVIPAKTALEQSWLRENATKGLLRKEESIIENNLSSAKNSPQPGESTNKPSYQPKERPLKHMSARELGEHRAALIRAWSRRHKKPVETAADRMLKEEIKRQRLAMDALENKWRLREPASTNSASPSSATDDTKSMDFYRSEGDICPNAERYTNSNMWYKRKSPHALLEEKHKIEDRALVRSIRRIYESAYGIIDTQHRQGLPTEDHIPESASTTVSNQPPRSVNEEAPERSAPIAPKHKEVTLGQSNVAQTTEQASQPEPAMVTKPQNDPLLYQILAYDPSEKSIYTAVASSSYTPPTGEKVIPVSDALVKLNFPAKFLPHLAKHQANGYEVVSANKNLLVFKRTQQAAVSPEEPALSSEISSSTSASKSMRSSKSNINPIDGTGNENWIADLRPYTGDFASPTGFVNHDIYTDQTINSTASNQEAPPSPEQNIKVKRQEPVFSGQRKVGKDSASSSSSSSYPSRFGSYGEFRRRLRENRFRRLRRFFRRVFSIGLFTAMCCYVTGVIVESLRDVNDRNTKTSAVSVERSSGENRSRWTNFSTQNEARAAGTKSDGTISSTNKQQQASIDEEKVYTAAKAFVAGAVLLPLLKYIFRSGR